MKVPSRLLRKRCDVGSLPAGKAFEACAIHQEDVEPAIVVVIVKGDATPGRFQQIFILMLSAEDGLCVQARLTSYIEKADAEICALLFRRIRTLPRTPEQPSGTHQREYAFQRKNERGTAE